MILWPCVATFNDGSIRSPVKVFTYADRPAEVWAWRDQPRPAEAEVIATGVLISNDEAHVYSLDGATPVGVVRIVVDPKACGCGHPLKFFRPGGLGPTRDEKYAPIL